MQSFSTSIIKDFNFSWHFSKGAFPDAMAVDFDDSNWDEVNIPHDWAISGPFGELCDDGNTGKLPWKGEGWYRKTFDLSEDLQDKRLIIIFDGVMSSPVVYLNGKKVGSWIYGYNSFYIDVTDAANFGGKNVLAVHADTREHGSRWYPGGGIYRKVTAVLKSQVSFEQWGTFVTTPEVADDSALVNVELKVRNDSDSDVSVNITSEIVNPQNKSIQEKSQLLEISSHGEQIVNFAFNVDKPELWDVESPNQYKVVSKLDMKGCIVDENITEFGIRSFQWTVDDGFYLNGRRLQIKGVNLHHDHGPLGSAFYPRAMERQLQIMKDMGVNSIRTSHNPSAPELLDLCDSMGLIVFNELFDKYGTTAGVDCSHIEFVEEYAEREVKNFVIRDRNHPCVCLWSIGNEIGEILHDIEGKSNELVTKMVDYFKKYDPTRPTTMGCHVQTGANKDLHIFDSLDSAGWNYGEKYIPFRKNYPDKPVIYSESASAFGTRGAYKKELPKSKTDWTGDCICTSHMLTSAVWSDVPDVEFDRMERHTYVAGEYVWTGFDYLGEPTPYGKNTASTEGYQARSSYFGIVDLVGLPKDSYYLYRSHWLPSETTLHLAPHWNWEKHEGESIPVIAYTNGDEAELFLNGKSMGKRKKVNLDSQNNNLAQKKQTSASSEEIIQDKLGNVIAENYSIKAIDSNPDTCWRAAEKTFPQYWQIDLESITLVKHIMIIWEEEAMGYKFELQVSDDHKEWKTVEYECENNFKTSVVSIENLETRFIRVNILEAPLGKPVSITEFAAYSDKNLTVEEDSYFNIVDKYRMRWLNVPYEPGEIKVVAYKDGIELATEIVKTAEEPYQLKLTADRETINADGMDLCYITIEMLDQQGALCPKAMDMLYFDVDDNIEFLGAGNGNPMGHDVFTQKQHQLFYGKAVVILKSRLNKTGKSKLKVATTSGITAEISIDVGITK